MMACSLPLQMALQTSLMKEEEHGSVAVPVTSLCKQCKEEKLKHSLLQSKLSKERLLTDTVCLPSLSSAQQSLVHAVPLSAGAQEIRGRPSEPHSILWNSTANCSVHSCQYLLFWYLLHTYFQAFLRQCKVYKIPQGKKKLVEFPVEPHYFGTLDFTQLQ